MFGRAARQSNGDDLYARIGAFLADQGLSVDPAHYAFAYDILSNPDGDIAKAVAGLIGDGVRLNRREIEALGGSVVIGANAQRAAEDDAARIVADTRTQVDDFAVMMRAMHDETRGFGEDLAQSATALADAENGRAAGIEDLARLTGAMLARVRAADAQLVKATDETESLREKLALATRDARRDALTGLPNRRAFEEAFTTRNRDGGPYCLAVCDIDRFKLVNDRHGHGIGDRVLRAVAQTLGRECGDHFAARHGGEEFVILLGGIDLVSAADLLDGVRAIVAAKRLRTRDTDTPLGQVTVSIGVTAIHPDETSADCLTRADRLLYTAKTEGRDRVCAA